MRIAITNPTTWPRVRRGAERFVNELAQYLASRGHEATVIACKPGARETRREHGFTTDCHRRLWHPALARVGFLEFHAFAGTAFGALLRGRYDIVHCCTFTDAYAASIARCLTNVPYVFWVNALPPQLRYFRSLTLRGAVFRRSIRYADEVISLSPYMQNDFAERFGRGGTVIPVPVDTERFKLCTERNSARPSILCAAALDDQRKGGTLLMRAFDRLKARRPEVILQIAAYLSPEKERELFEYVSPRWRGDVHVLGNGSLDDLPKRFGAASVSVLPSRWEAFGMVILESMATGTPVVGTRDGAIPGLISDPGVGCLFEAGPAGVPEPTNLDGLVQALDDGIELSQRPETPRRCRAHAEQYSWSVVGPRYEALYDELIAQRRRGVARP
ncbi:MAG: glycosyltransferase family 4 protein [bacterium]|nr:glycosyltransferase family 4 protein [bacterium]